MKLSDEQACAVSRNISTPTRCVGIAPMTVVKALPDKPLAAYERLKAYRAKFD
jgi:hypothetical protein